MECRIVIFPEGGELRYKTFEFSQLLRMSAHECGVAVQEAIRELFANLPVEKNPPAFAATADIQFAPEVEAYIRQLDRRYAAQGMGATTDARQLAQQQAAMQALLGNTTAANQYAGQWRFVTGTEAAQDPAFPPIETPGAPTTLPPGEEPAF